MKFKHVSNFVVDIVETVVIALSIFVVIYLLAFQPHEVKGQSMDGIDGFHDGQYILTDKLSYRFREPERGEVIVFRYPLKKELDYIKRIIAVPGDQIELRDNDIYIFNPENPNGIPLDETEYLSESVNTEAKAFLKEGVRIQVSEDEYFVMGDNRPQSSDSRTWGFISREDVIGRSFFRYWPPNEVGLIKHHNPIEE